MSDFLYMLHLSYIGFELFFTHDAIIISECSGQHLSSRPMHCEQQPFFLEWPWFLNRNPTEVVVFDMP